MDLDLIKELNPDAYLIDGFDEAILGIGERIGLSPVVIYDEDKIIDILMSRIEDSDIKLEEGETIDEVKYIIALEYYEFNIKGAYVGEGSPIFLIKLEN